MTERMPPYSLDDLLYLMERLRDPDTGCPWDCKQTLQSLAPFALEEAFEVADAIERGDFSHLPEELGDLLFQVIFQAQLGKEKGGFEFADIVHAITSKLVSRHPHVFPDGTLNSRRPPGEIPDDTDINRVWEHKKQQERARKGAGELLADIPVVLPALSRAQKVQKRVSRVGFDWPDRNAVVAKIREEISELEAELPDADKMAMEDELGDVLFSVVNLSRHLGLDAETALRRATLKFERRFAQMEATARKQGVALDEMSERELDSLWERAKANLREG